MILCCLAIQLQAEPDPAERRVESYPLVTADSKEIVEALKDLIGDEGKVYFYKPANEIIVNATEKGHKLTADLLAEVNRKPVNVRIEVSMKQAGSSVESGFDLNPSGAVRRTKAGTQYRVRARPELSSRSTRRDTMTSSQLTVRSGGEASIFVGQDVPFVKWLIHFAGEHGLVEPEIEMRKVGASLVVQPVVIGNGPMVNVKLIPQLSGMIDDPDGKRDSRLKRIRYTNMATEVVAVDGQPLSIGGMLKKGDFYEKFLVGFDEKGNRSSLQITLTPFILSADGVEVKARE